MDEVEFSIEAAIAKGRPLPDWIEEEPYIHPHDLFYLDAFSELTTCRHVGMDICPIPWTVIIQYAEYHGLERDLHKPFLQIIRAIDKAFLEHLQSKKGGK